LGNTKLVEHGIQTEHSDIRAHVAVIAKTVYMFKTENGVKAINKGQYKRVPVKTGEIVTAEGYLVPPGDIEGIELHRIPDDILKEIDFRPWDNPSTLGRKAERTIKIMINRKLILIPSEYIEIDEEDMQMGGSDGILQPQEIEVKCDYRGGHREYGGTGNLFLQVSECNPLKQH